MDWLRIYLFSYQEYVILYELIISYHWILNLYLPLELPYDLINLYFSYLWYIELWLDRYLNILLLNILFYRLIL